MTNLYWQFFYFNNKMFMRNYLLLFTLLIFHIKTINAQKLLTIEKGCSFYGEVESEQINVKECTNVKVLKIINDVLSTVSLQENFKVYEANIGNAIATRIGNERLLIVDPSFLNEIEVYSKDKFTSYLIIAHEIGHHLNNHIEKPSDASPWWDELEADYFAGSTLQKLGIPPSTIGNVINLIAPRMSNSKTHPEWQARMKATINGYCQSVFIEEKQKINSSQKINDNLKIQEEKVLETVLNSNIYNKADWERNIKYKVANNKIIKEYETNLNNNEGFRKEKYTLNINDISKIYLRWHDPGEIAFETPNDTKIETLQGKVAVQRLNPNAYFDDETTIKNDFNIILAICKSVARLQKYSELK